MSTVGSLQFFLFRLGILELRTSLKWLILADTAALITAPLTGKTIRAAVFLAANGFRYIYHAKITRQPFKSHFYPSRLTVWLCLPRRLIFILIILFPLFILVEAFTLPACFLPYIPPPAIIMAVVARHKNSSQRQSFAPGNSVTAESD